MGSSKSKIAKDESPSKNDEIKKIKENQDPEKVKEETEVKEIKEIKEVKETKTHISEEKIDEFVNEILRDQNININYFPDAVERKLYRNVLILVFSLLNKTVDTASIQLIGHEIKFTMSPLK